MATARQRFPMRLERCALPFLAICGGLPRWSYVEVGPQDLLLRFGWAFAATIPRDEIEFVRPARWSPLVGLGWRVTLNGSIGLIGSLAGVVEIGLRRRRLFRLAVLPWPTRRLFVSLQDPEAFLHALTSLPSPS